jgi:Protein of unknown function (DUF3565)
MHRRIVGFHQDVEQHWVADLECGHAQHVRHEPPLQTREWVLEERTRRQHLGTTLDCLSCDAPQVPEDASSAAARARAAWEDARMRGLSEDGAGEAARE